LRDFELLCEIPFDAGEQDFALPGFESVHGRRQGSLVVGIGELNQFLKRTEQNISLNENS
jgi:hypothetical protein